MNRKLVLILLAITLMLTACNLPQRAKEAPQAWIDDPLDGMRLPMQPYTFTLHSSDPAGIAQMEVSVNGQVLATVKNPNPADLLVSLTQTWNPPSPGRYVIRARAQNVSGSWSGEDLVTVEVVEVPTPTPTDVASLTPTVIPTVTSSPTLVPSETPTPSPTPVLEKGFAGRPVFSPYQINLPYDCASSNLTAEIKVNPGQKIKVVVLFYRPSNNDFTLRAEWADIAMTPVGADIYRITFNPIKAGGFKPWFGSVGASAGWEGWLQTQFVIQDMDGVLTRSDLFSQVKIAGCH